MYVQYNWWLGFDVWRKHSCYASSNSVLPPTGALCEWTHFECYSECALETAFRATHSGHCTGFRSIFSSIIFMVIHSFASCQDFVFRMRVWAINVYYLISVDCLDCLDCLEISNRILWSILLSAVAFGIPNAAIVLRTQCFTHFPIFQLAITSLSVVCTIIARILLADYSIFFLSHIPTAKSSRNLCSTFFVSACVPSCFACVVHWSGYGGKNGEKRIFSH